MIIIIAVSAGDRWLIYARWQVSSKFTDCYIIIYNMYYIQTISEQTSFPYRRLKPRRLFCAFPTRVYDINFNKTSVDYNHLSTEPGAMHTIRLNALYYINLSVSVSNSFTIQGDNLITIPIITFLKILFKVVPLKYENDIYMWVSDIATIPFSINFKQYN